MKTTMLVMSAAPAKLDAQVMKVIGDLRLAPSHPFQGSPPHPPHPPVFFKCHSNTSRSFLDQGQLPLRQLHLERALLPDDDDLALVGPVLLARQKLIVEAEEEPRDSDAQLRVGQVLAQAVPGSEAEGVCRRGLVSEEIL